MTSFRFSNKNEFEIELNAAKNARGCSFVTSSQKTGFDEKSSPDNHAFETGSKYACKVKNCWSLSSTIYFGIFKCENLLFFSTRASAAALHLGRSACTIPEHDDLHKRNERLKEALKKEKEQTSIIRQEFEEKESEIVRENAKLRAQLEEMHDDRVKTAQRHEREISLLADQHRKMEKQREISHQNEIKKIFLKNEEQIADKNKGFLSP